ncbi:MAG TPA: GNAT family N-acetyltransferase [Bryobacteraceae bacterium]|nr:GNAT family N-acetyltransferase [Bryobacteraceae bacterium]
MGIEVRQANAADIAVLVPLFDAYRLFYRQESDLEGGRRFLMERLNHNQSVIFLAFHDDAAIGFTQLYPSFSSAAMARIYILNDLFVVPEARKLRAGSALLHAAAEYGKRMGAVRLVLSTEETNAAAQALYEKEGWTRDAVFRTYQLKL